MAGVDKDILAQLGLSEAEVEGGEEKWSSKASDEATESTSDIMAQLGLGSDMAGEEAWEKKAENASKSEQSEKAIAAQEEANILKQLGLEVGSLSRDEHWLKKTEKDPA